MNTDSSTPVDLVNVAIPKKKQPKRAAESNGKSKFLLFVTTRLPEYI